MRTDGRTRVTKLSGAFRGYAHMSEYCYVSSLSFSAVCCDGANKEHEMRHVGLGVHRALSRCDVKFGSRKEIQNTQHYIAPELL